MCIRVRLYACVCVYVDGTTYFIVRLVVVVT